MKDSNGRSAKVESPSVESHTIGVELTARQLAHVWFEGNFHRRSEPAGQKFDPNVNSHRGHRIRPARQYAGLTSRKRGISCTIEVLRPAPVAGEETAPPADAPAAALKFAAKARLTEQPTIRIKRSKWEKSSASTWAPRIAACGHPGRWPAQSHRKPEGARTTPSIVAYQTTARSPSVRRQASGGHESQEHASAVKRLIGRRFEEKEVQKSDIDLMPYKIFIRTTTAMRVKARCPDAPPQKFHVSSAAKMKKTAEDHFRRRGDRGRDHGAGVSTTPPPRRGPHCGLEVKPHRHQRADRGCARLVWTNRKAIVRSRSGDPGGGTFDVSIIEIASVDGEHHLKCCPRMATPSPVARTSISA